MALLVWRGPGAAGSNYPLFGQQREMAKIGAEKAWATGTGTGVTIAVIDTGVDLHHEDLREDLAAKIVSGHNFIDEGTPPQDDNGHGP